MTEINEKILKAIQEANKSGHVEKTETKD